MYTNILQHCLREDLSFSYLIGTKADLDSQVDIDTASDFAFNNELLFNEVSAKNFNNIDLVLKTLRTRAARLVSEIGVGLARILQNLQVSIQIKSQTIDEEEEIAQENSV